MSFVFEVKSKLKDWHAKLVDALQRMITQKEQKNNKKYILKMAICTK
jgi:GH18 family chitinase